jgi:hypothetical protein
MNEQSFADQRVQQRTRLAVAHRQQPCSLPNIQAETGHRQELTPQPEQVCGHEQDGVRHEILPTRIRQLDAFAAVYASGVPRGRVADPPRPPPSRPAVDRVLPPPLPESRRIRWHRPCDSF